MTVRRMVGGALAAGCLVLAVGCSSGSESSDTASDAVSNRDVASSEVESSASESGSDSALMQTDAAAPAVGAAEPESAPEAPATPDPVTATPAAAGRSVVSTAMVTVESDNVIEARQRTAAIVSAAGGAIYDEQTELGETGRTTLTLKVPPDQFEAVLTQLGQVGKLTNQNISTEDVTAQVVDLDARISSAEASVARTRLLMDQATTIADIAMLENELSTRETALETLRGQKRTLDARVDLATVVLTVTPPPAVAPPPPPEEATSLPGFLDGLSAGWTALVSALTVVATIAGWALPFIPFIVALALAIRWYRRRNTATQPAA